jgi:hypothetical protein
MTTNTAVQPLPTPEEPSFDRWEADDALDALHRAGLDIDHVEQARWPANAPQPRTQRQAYTFRSPGAIDPHLLLVFDTAEALEAWRLWLARYWRARPYISIRDNVLLLVSRSMSEADAARFHAALGGLSEAPHRLTVRSTEAAVSETQSVESPS